MFGYRYDWQGNEDDSPEVIIIDTDGADMLQIFERPKYMGGDPYEAQSWKLGSFAESVLSAINVADANGHMILEVASGLDPSLDDIFIPENEIRAKLNTLKFDFKRISQPFCPTCERTCGTNNK